MTDMIAIELEGQHLDVELDHERCTWMPFDDVDTELLEESAFPFVAIADGSRYELFGDGTFARRSSGRYDM
jgi:hypothetical protein